MMLFRYACLVAETAIDDPDSAKQLVGVIDVTVLRDQNVLQHLPPEAEEYLYISGIAVSKTFRWLSTQFDVPCAVLLSNVCIFM